MHFFWVLFFIKELHPTDLRIHDQFPATIGNHALGVGKVTDDLIADSILFSTNDGQQTLPLNGIRHGDPGSIAERWE